MRRRSPRQPSAAKMIRDYLGAVSTAATRKLPKGDRLLFVGRTRAALEAQVGPLASADDADAVAAALTALGDPDELAAKERERLYSARRRGAAAEPPTLWKPPGKTSRRATPPGRPPRSGPAEPRSACGLAESRPRRSRTWPYRRTGPDDPALPGAPPAPAGSGTAEPGRPGPGNPEPKKPEPGTAGPGSTVHIPQPRQPEQPPRPAIRPAPPGWDARRDGAQPGTATGPASAGRDTGRDGAPPGRKPGTVGPGTAGSAGWLGPAGTGTPTGTAGPGAAQRDRRAGRIRQECWAWCAWRDGWAGRFRQERRAGCVRPECGARRKPWDRRASCAERAQRGGWAGYAERRRAGRAERRRGAGQPGRRCRAWPGDRRPGRRPGDAARAGPAGRHRAAVHRAGHGNARGGR